MKTKFGKFLSSRAFPVYFFLFLLAAMLYVVLRTGGTLAPVWGVSAYGWVAAAFAVLFILHLLLRNKGSFTTAYRLWMRAEGVILCFLLYLILCLLGCDLLGLILWLFIRSSTVFTVSWCIAMGLAMLILLYGMIHARRLKTVPYRLKLGESGHTYRLVLLSDLHIGVFVGPHFIEKMVRQVNALTPDMVVIAGDVFDNGYAGECAGLDRVCASLRRLETRDGVFAVLGNHDPAYTDQAMQTFFQDAHIRLLYNEAYETPHFYLAGRNDLLHSAKHKEPLPSLNEWLTALPEKKPVVVADHNPDGIDEAAENGAALVLCGHNHKGQFFPMDILTRLSHAKNHFYGLERFGGTQVVISAGTGYFRLPIRVGSDSEIVEITLEL